jgi:hypothetical protein
LNVRIEKPDENTEFNKVHVPYVRPPSTLLPMSEVYANLFNNYDNTPSCALMEEAVRTFDNVTYDMPDNQCQYLVAKDCSSEERFAVFATELDQETNTKKITFLTAGHEIILTPPHGNEEMQVKINGKTHELNFAKPVTANDGKIRVYLRKTVSAAQAPIAVVESDRDDVTVLYDGKNAKILLKDNRYQGKTCGLCADNNDEQEEEFVGPDMCIYKEAEDFANSYAMAGEQCEQVPIPSGPKRCPAGVKKPSININEARTEIKKRVKVVNNPTGTSVFEQTQIKRKPSLKEKIAKVAQRNLVEAIDDKICFSNRAYPICAQNAQPVALREEVVAFHCLPAQSPFAQQLVMEAQSMVLTQLVNKRVDLREARQIAVSCA